MADGSYVANREGVLVDSTVFTKNCKIFEKFKNFTSNSIILASLKKSEDVET